MDALLSVFAWAMMVVIVIAGFFIQLVLFVLTAPFDRGRRISGRWLRLMAVGFAKVSPFWHFRIHGEAPARPTRRTVVVSNHVSNADVFLISLLPWEMKWLAKSELFKVPFVGWSLWLAGDVPVTRGQKASGHHALELCKRWLERGVPVAIFPEGTRSASGELGAFKEGAFKLAIDAHADILPVAVAGTRRALPKHSWKFGRARGLLAVGQPLSTEGLGPGDVEALKAKARAAIESLRATIVPLTEIDEDRATT
ncbi:MAG: 1-acyl-sn-glycerol-3-phosphate acyltransferase [Myxococcaceae bacterium]|nr:1-acyl-sn-glycerol-3-phosphate acyltransferase [Myxococcaceae bacterium]